VTVAERDEPPGLASATNANGQPDTPTPGPTTNHDAPDDADHDG
jgi:hypothetical protein